jgi:hypothetical protein
MNPNYLLKEEILYELAIRGIVSEADVPALHKLFRAVIGEGVRVQTSYLQAVSVDELYSLIISKTNELQSFVAVATTEPSPATQCFLTRLHHLQGRLQHIKDLGVLSKDVTTSHYSELQERLSSMERELELRHPSDGAPDVREEAEADTERQRETGTDLRYHDQWRASENNEGVSTGRFCLRIILCLGQIIRICQVLIQAEA